MTDQASPRPERKPGSRRGLVIGGLVALLIAAAIGARAFVRSLARPNVLLLVMDTTRADRCSFTGGARVTTPRLDEYARQSTVFLDAWSPASWTGPSHASLFTGLRPEHHGFYDGNRDWLEPNVPTIASILAAANYATACFTNNDVITDAFGMTRGFEEVVPLYQQGRAYPWAAETHELAAKWAREQADARRPFFLFINDMEPHAPFVPPHEFERQFVRGDPDPAELAQARAYDFPRPLAFSLRKEELTPRQLGILSDLYDAEIAALDREIGVLLDRLRDDGLLDSTIVVIAGDHGELLGEHHLMGHGFTLHRAIRHVPLLVRWPRAFEGGRRESAVVRLEDVMPTILELCGLPVPPGLDGVSLLRDLGGRVSLGIQGAKPERRAWVEGHVPGSDPTALIGSSEAVYDGRFHALRYADGRVERYDLDADPGELTDLSRDGGAKKDEGSGGK